VSAHRIKSGAQSALRNGGASRNSASEPDRMVLRFHSSTETRTAVGRPFLVIVCWPVRRAVSISSDSGAFASATVYAAMMLEPIGFKRASAQAGWTDELKRACFR